MDHTTASRRTLGEMHAATTLRRLGWTVRRFDEEQITYHPESVLGAIRRLLTDLGACVAPVPPPLPDLGRRPLPPWLVP